jgi:two-component system, NarL family, nitrate/nitrite response regulator NarL
LWDPVTTIWLDVESKNEVLVTWFYGGAIVQDDCIRILVGDSSRLNSNVLADALRRDQRFDVVQVCASAAEILSSADLYKPDVVLISADLDDVALKGFDVCYRLGVAHPESAVVILVNTSVRDVILGAFAAGARGIFSRDDSIEALSKCIYSVCLGQVWAKSKEMRFLLEAYAGTTPRRLLDAKGTVLLSKREQEVVGCVAEGLTNREIAARLSLSEHTIKNYIFRIFEKLGVSTRVELVLYSFSQRSSSRSGIDSDESLSDDQVSELERYHARAETGDSLAQLRLAEIYSRDPAAARDNHSVSMWLMLAETIASAVRESARAALVASASSLDTQEIAEIKARVRKWLALHTDGLGHLLKPQLTTPSNSNGEERGERYTIRSPRALGVAEQGLGPLARSARGRKKGAPAQAIA